MSLGPTGDDKVCQLSVSSPLKCARCVCLCDPNGMMQRRPQVKETHRFKSLCQSARSSPTRASLLSVLLFRRFISCSLKDIIPRLSVLTSSPFIHSPAPFLVRLPPCLLRLSAVSFMFLEPLLTHSLCASSIVSLFWQVFCTFLKPFLY